MHVAIVLPPRERFAPGAAGAVAAVARLQARFGRLPATVFGVATPDPWEDFRPVQPSPWSGYAAAVARALRHDPPALVEVHNRPELARALARRHRTSLLLHNDPQEMRGLRTQAARDAFARRIEVRAVSGWVAARFGPGAAVLANAIDLAELPPSGPRERSILFAGRVVADKGADIFVEACALALPDLPGWRAELVGADRFGPDSPDTPFLCRLRGRAAAAGVRLAGWQPHDAVLAAMARAAIVVMPGRWPEPFGLVALEAMASGAALLFAPRGGLPEVVGDAGCALASEDPAAWAAALRALAGDPARRAALQAAGHARAARFAAPRMAARLDALRDSALALPPPI